MSHISAIKKDMVILERSEFSALRAENEVGVTQVMIDFKGAILLSFLKFKDDI